MNEIKVLYEDNHLIAVNKPSGVLAQGDHTGDDSLLEQVKRHIKEKYQKPGNVFVGLIHRLDRPVSGVVLFAKTSKGASRISEQFREGTISKIYHAVVEGKMEKDAATLFHFIEKVGDKNFIAKVRDIPGKNTARAELSYKVVATNDKYSLLKVDLGTGKFHQIRSQLAYIGHPIVGDVKYGARQALKDQSIMLRATSLSFKMVTGEEKRTISIEPPQLP